MKRSDRIKELEENATGIDPEYRELMELYFQFEKALEDGNTKTAIKARRKAEKWITNEGRFTKFAFFPPNDADVSGIVELRDWIGFVKFNFNR